YEDKNFREKLIDAATSMKVGSVWNAGNVVGPMITNQNDKLLEGLTLQPGESWLVKPRFLDEKRYMLAPTIKWGVRPQNFTFRTELFGPMLSVACIENLQEGIDLVNGLDYGLTSGLQSLDETEQKLWRDSVMAGNLYINRGITGAIVNRQPFGGMKQSAFGGGIKAGGPNYCACFVNIADRADSTTDYVQSYSHAYETEFAHAHDWNKLHGEQNAFRYLPLKNMALRLFPGDSNEDALKVALAARLCHTPLTISFDADDERAAALAATGCRLVQESVAEFIGSMNEYERIRTCSPDIPMEMYQAAAAIDKYIATARPVNNGRVELIHYIKEQSISFEYHRYGSIADVPPVE
ncbi:MAG: aldehyde dehydrogenase family protein, partial [Prevotellaceae bacterium]|nr:aldehyde dehydrogenase family protein [Prevotellaceae bacterium]